MRVLVIAAQKGGVGKTTLSAHLAVAAVRAGVGEVALVDTDPQGSLAAWWNARQASAPQFLNASLDQLPAVLPALRAQGFQLLVIDTPPALTTSIRLAVDLADLVLIPTRPGPHDLRAIGATIALADQANKPTVFVLNAAPTRARITRQAAAALTEHDTVAPTIVHQRVVFASSMIDGRTAGEIQENTAAAQEISALWAYLEERMRTSAST